MAEKEKLFQENEAMRTELTAARMEHSKVQTALMARDAELERRNVEIGSLQSDKASLDKMLQVRHAAGKALPGRYCCWCSWCLPCYSGLQLTVEAAACCRRIRSVIACADKLLWRPTSEVLQEKQSEISELQTRLAAAADRNVALTEANSALDAQLHEAQAASSRAALTQSRLEQEKEIMQKTNAWLSQVRGRPWEMRRYWSKRRKCAVSRHGGCSVCDGGKAPAALCGLPGNSKHHAPVHRAHSPLFRSWSASLMHSTRSGARQRTPFWTCSGGWQRLSRRRSACRQTTRGWLRSWRRRGRRLRSVLADCGGWVERSVLTH